MNEFEFIDLFSERQRMQWNSAQFARSIRRNIKHQDMEHPGRRSEYIAFDAVGRVWFSGGRRGTATTTLRAREYGPSVSLGFIFVPSRVAQLETSDAMT